MATKTLWFINAAASGSAHGSLQDGGSAPTTATTTTGWIVGTNAAGNFARMDFGVERARTVFSTTDVLAAASAPDNSLGSCWRTQNPITGHFDAGNWSIAATVRAVTAGGVQDGRANVRVWASTDPTGTTGQRELTSGKLTGSTVTNLATSADQTSTVTWAASAIDLSNEYLFFDFQWEVTGAGSGTTQDVDFRVGSAASKVTTTNFTHTLTANNLTVGSPDVGTSQNTIFSGTLPSHEAGETGFDIRNSYTLTGGGGGSTQVRVTFGPGDSGSNVTADHASIGVWGGVPGFNDTTDVPVELLFGGASGYTAPVGGSAPSDWTTTPAFTASDRLIVIMSFTSNNTGINTADANCPQSGFGTNTEWNSATDTTASANSDTNRGVLSIETRVIGPNLSASGAGSNTLTASNLTVGSPSLGTPSVICAVASGLTTSSPVLGSPILAHALATSGLATGSPAIGSPILAHALATSGLATGSPVLGSPALGQDHKLAAQGLTVSSPSIGTAAIAVVVPLATAGLAVGAPEIGAFPVLGIVVPLAAGEMATGSPDLPTVPLAQVHSLAASPLAVGSPGVGLPDLVGVVALDASGLATGSPVLGSPDLLQVQALDALDLIVHSPAFTKPVLSPPGILAAQNLEVQSPEFGTPSLGQVHAFVSDPVAVSSPEIGTPDLHLTSVLTASDLVTASPVLGTPILVPNSVLVTAGIEVAAPSIGSPDFNQRQVLSATGVAVGSPSLDNPQLIVVDVFSASDLSASSPAIGQSQIGQDHHLAGGLETSPLSIGQPTLGQIHDLIANGIDVSGALGFGSPSVNPFIEADRSVAVDVTGTRAQSTIVGRAAKLSVTGKARDVIKGKPHG